MRTSRSELAVYRWRHVLVRLLVKIARLSGNFLSIIQMPLMSLASRFELTDRNTSEN